MQYIYIYIYVSMTVRHVVVEPFESQRECCENIFGGAVMCEKSGGEKWKVEKALQSRERLQRGTVLTTPNTR